MKNKKSIAIIVLIILIICGFFLWQTVNNNDQTQSPKNNIALEELFKINTTLEMNDMQKTIYNEAKIKLQENPEDYESLLNLARLKQDLLDHDGAIAMYQDLREKKPEDILPLNNLGTIYYNQKKYEEAEEMYLAILEITPKWTNSYRELTNIYRYHLKDKKEEIESLLLNGMEKYPEMKNDFIGLLTVYYDEVVPNKEKAIEYYEKLIALYPGNDNFEERLEELKNQ
ncbi:MAG: tetratricopeptide repeat protein [Candidatus Pacebacteria bacterium]|nr:tetratricopeptide repeat protein [Candidatus Paceibacterota bacterium]